MLKKSNRFNRKKIRFNRKNHDFFPTLITANVTDFVNFQKNGREFEKLRRTLKPNELQATMTAVSGEQRLEILEEQYQECVREYMHVLDRIAEAT